MGEVTLETKAYTKLILHAAKYPHCAVNGLLLADASRIKDVNKVDDLVIVDSVPLFHQCLYLAPMAEVALTQVDSYAQSNDMVVAGYYAACENLKDNSVDKCPGGKIAEKIAEYFPSAVFIVVDNPKLMLQLSTPAIKLYQNSDGKWKQKDPNSVIFDSNYVLETVSHLLQRGVARDLVDFDNHLDDISQDWTNSAIDTLLASMDKDEDDD